MRTATHQVDQGHLGTRDDRLGITQGRGQQQARRVRVVGVAPGRPCRCASSAGAAQGGVGGGPAVPPLNADLPDGVGAGAVLVHVG